MMKEISFEELLQDDTEETYPMMIPDDAEGFSWHIENMTKEEVIATLEANSCKNDEISEMIIDYNEQYIAEFDLEVVKFSDATVGERFDNDFGYCVSFALCLTALFLCVLFLIFEILPRLSDY